MKKIQMRLTITKIMLLLIVCMLVASFIVGAIMSGVVNTEVVKNTHRPNYKRVSAETAGEIDWMEQSSLAGADMWTQDIQMNAGIWDQEVASVGAQALMTSARAMATVELQSGRLLYEKNAYERLPMASTTKILTAITVLEHVSCSSEVVKVNDKAIGIEGSSIYLQKGEELTVKELLLGLMLRSGNDAAVALALHVSKTVEDFAFLMNATAFKAGAKDSSFKNPHGLDEKDHYTTAYDLAMISAYAMRNPEFAEISATKEARISGKEYPRVIQNKNKLLRSNEGVIGVKTGFTKKAGRCFVGAMEENGMTVINVVLNCGPMFPESEYMMERAGDEFYMHKVLDKEKLVQFETVSEKGKPMKFAGMVEEDLFYPVKRGEEDKFEIKMNKHEILVHFDGEIVQTVLYSSEFFEGEDEMLECEIVEEVA
ncbi:MAG: D-alanyl-D-alanine carboxypeptidase [Firmicutes bacterium]|nr:D-alanyl-D-alanine carboxypeptidase [Bacillota bacterium]